MKFIAPWLAVLLLSGGLGARAAAAGADTLDQGPAPAIAELKNFAAAYNEAVLQKNRVALLHFYYNDHVPVTGVIAPASFALLTKQSKGKAKQINQDEAWVVSTGEMVVPNSAEKTTLLAVRTDGSVADMQFDYATTPAHGHIFWTLARGADGWKITSTVYSINLTALDHAPSN